MSCLMFDDEAVAGLMPAIKTYSFTATLAANGTCAIPTPPADLHFIIGVTYSGGGYCYWSVGTQYNANKALMFTNSDGTKMTGTFDFTIAYI